MKKIVGMILVNTMLMATGISVNAATPELYLTLDRERPANGLYESEMGYGVASLGDVNNDGYDDWAVSFQDAYDYATGKSRGKVYIYLGGAIVQNESAPFLIITGPLDSTVFGRSVAGAGDVNGDGYDDVVIGDYLNDDGGIEAGLAWIYFGGSSMDALPDVRMYGVQAGDRFGRNVAGAGDVNNDGYDDVIVGAPGTGSVTGKAYVFFGGATMNGNADVLMAGATTSDRFGYAVSSAGDVNHDNYADVMVGSPWSDNTGTSAGSVSVFYGGASMDGTPDLIFNGESAGDNFGMFVASAGDVNKDDYDDILISAVYNSTAYSHAGRAYLYFGGATMDTTVDVIMSGHTENDYFGYGLAGAGDMNHDGYDDVVVGAPEFNWGSDMQNAGRVYMFYGGAAMNNIADMMSTGTTADGMHGYSVCGNLDVDHDGFDDILVGAPYDSTAGTYSGSVSLLLGGASANNTVDAVFYGRPADEYFGGSVANAGDVNGDGYTDFLVGAPNVDHSQEDVGMAYLYLGGANPRDQQALVLEGEAENNRFGVAVAGAGDVNHDGYADMIVGAMRYDAAGTTMAGRAYIYYGGRIPDNQPDLIMTGTECGSYFGSAVAGVGDVNRDGYDDVAVGAKDGDGSVPDGGVVYLFFGGQTMDNNPDVILDGAVFQEKFGLCVSGAGDVNGDGYDDVLVGAPQHNAEGSNTGRAYLYYGGQNMDSNLDWIMTGKAEGNYFGFNAAGVGDVNGDGYDDVLVDAQFDSTYSTCAGCVYLYCGSASGMSVEPEMIFRGTSAAEYLGICLAGAGDINHDGYDDIMIASKGSDDKGHVYVYFGGETMDDSVDMHFDGLVSGGQYGQSVASLEQYNDSGVPAIVVGAYLENRIGKKSGRVYVYAAENAATVTPTPITIVENNIQTLGQEVLAYPNPAKRYVRFAVEESAVQRIEIRVFNMAGETIALLTKDVVSGDPTGRIVVWDADGVAPGLYCYQTIVSVNGQKKKLAVHKLAIAK